MCRGLQPNWAYPRNSDGHHPNKMFIIYCWSLRCFVLKNISEEKYYVCLKNKDVMEISFLVELFFDAQEVMNNI